MQSVEQLTWWMRRARIACGIEGALSNKTVPVSALKVQEQRFVACDNCDQRIDIKTMQNAHNDSFEVSLQSIE